MAETHPADLSLTDAAAALRDGRLTAIDLLDACLERIEERNGGAPTFDGAADAVNAWAHLYVDDARAAARRADERLAGGDAPVLCGIPIGLKDLFAVAGRPLEASSRHLAGNIATHDSAAWRALDEVGAVLVGHTHTHEFAAGGTTDQVGNPWDLRRSPGGSSGGSGAAVAAGMVPATLGTDTAGSIRVPAALCGVSGFKGSYGRVPTDGVLPLSPSLDHAGPIAATLRDCAHLFAALTRADRAPDPWGVAGRPPVPFDATAVPGDLRGVRVALTDRVDATDTAPDIRAGLERAREAVLALGGEIVELPAAPDLDKQDFDAILIAEARAVHARYAAHPDRYRPSTRDFIAPGAGPLPVDVYLAAQARRLEITAGWQTWFAEHRVDVLLEPTTATTAPLRGHGYDAGRAVGGTDPLIRYTGTWDATGFPVAAIPAGLGDTGLPVGVSLVGPAGADARVLAIGIALQEGALPALPSTAPR